MTLAIGIALKMAACPDPCLNKLVGPKPSSKLALIDGALILTSVVLAILALSSTLKLPPAAAYGLFGGSALIILIDSMMVCFLLKQKAKAYEHITNLD